MRGKSTEVEEGIKPEQADSEKQALKTGSWFSRVKV